jgi:hypothetical protein
VSETTCPFCGGALDDEPRGAPRPVAPVQRLTRAALFAVGAGTAMFSQGCASNDLTAFPAYGGVAPLEDASVGDGMAFVDGGPFTPCEVAGGECSATGCAYSISASCGVGGGTCCVPCQAAPDVHQVLVSTYNQECSADSDCVAVGTGDPCRPCDIVCGANAAINKTSLSKYRSDVAAVIAAADAGSCTCAPVTTTVCCNAGTCDPSCGADGSSNALPPDEASVVEASAVEASVEDAPYGDGPGAHEDGDVDAGGDP